MQFVLLKNISKLVYFLAVRQFFMCCKMVDETDENNCDTVSLRVFVLHPKAKYIYLICSFRFRNFEDLQKVVENGERSTVNGDSDKISYN